MELLLSTCHEQASDINTIGKFGYIIKRDIYENKNQYSRKIQETLKSVAINVEFKTEEKLTKSINGTLMKDIECQGVNIKI